MAKNARKAVKKSKPVRGAKARHKRGTGRSSRPVRARIGAATAKARARQGGRQSRSEYGAHHIEVLEGWSGGRAAGMYVGGTTSGAASPFLRVIDNAMDEAVAHHASTIEVEITPTASWVSDNGRGIRSRSTQSSRRNPRSKFDHDDGCHAGGKFNHESLRDPAACTASACRWRTRFRSARKSRSRAAASLPPLYSAACAQTDVKLVRRA